MDWSYRVYELETSGRYSEAFELLYHVLSRLDNYRDIYNRLYRYRQECPSFRPSDPRLKEMYRALSCSDWLLFVSEGEKTRIVNDMRRLGLMNEAIDALRRGCPSSFDGAHEPAIEHFMVAEIYENLGDWEAAATIYEDFWLIDRAAKCYDRSNKIDKVAIYLLAEGRTKQCVDLYEGAGRRDRVEWVTGVCRFSPATWQHPLLTLSGFNSDRRGVLGEVGDEFHRLLHAWRAGDTYTQSEARSVAKVFLEFKSPSHEILPTELEVLLREMGCTELADQVAAVINDFRQAATYPLPRKYWEDGRLWNTYLLSGQYFKGIVVGEMMAERSRRRRQLGPAGDIARCYEAVGAFSEAIQWKIDEIDGLSRSGEMERFGSKLFQDLARLYLKNGTFANAGKALHKCWELRKGEAFVRVPEAEAKGCVIAAELCRCGGDTEGSTNIIQDLIARYHEPALASALESGGFFEEAARIYEEMGGKADGADPGKETAPTAAPVPSDGQQRRQCTCGQMLQPHWLKCPKCKRGLHMDCICGEPLEAGWDECPACGRAVRG